MTAPLAFIARELQTLLDTIGDLAALNATVTGGVAYDDLAVVVKVTREKRHQSQRDVGVLANIDPGIVWRIEHGKPVNPKNLAAIARWLGMSIVFPP